MFAIIFSLLCLLLAFYLYLTWNFDYWTRRGVGGPIPRAYLGNFPKTALLDKNSNYMTEMGEIYRLVRVFTAFRRIYSLSAQLTTLSAKLNGINFVCRHISNTHSLLFISASTFGSIVS